MKTETVFEQKNPFKWKRDGLWWIVTEIVFLYSIKINSSQNAMWFMFHASISFSRD